MLERVDPSVKKSPVQLAEAPKSFADANRYASLVEEQFEPEDDEEFVDLTIEEPGDAAGSELLEDDGSVVSSAPASEVGSLYSNECVRPPSVPATFPIRSCRKAGKKGFAASYSSVSSPECSVDNCACIPKQPAVADPSPPRTVSEGKIAHNPVGAKKKRHKKTSKLNSSARRKKRCAKEATTSRSSEDNEEKEGSKAGVIGGASGVVCYVERLENFGPYDFDALVNAVADRRYMVDAILNYSK